MLVQKLIPMILSIIIDPIKSFYTVFSLILTSYIPDYKLYLMNLQSTSFDRMFQHTVWTLACIVSITAIYTFVEKQINDYRKKNHKPRKRSKKVDEEPGS